MRVHFCGVRGSTPASGADFVRYGGHTSCLAIAPDGDDPGRLSTPSLLLDSGTGIRRVTELLDGEPFVGTILLTHLHWDHFQGLPFFRAGDRDDAEVRLLLPDPADGRDAEEVLAQGMSPPIFPIRPRELRGKWAFELLVPGCFEVARAPRGQLDPDRSRAASFAVEAREVPHKGGRTFGYRVSEGSSTLVYIPDHCPTVLGDGPDGLGEYHLNAIELAKGADVLVHDAHLLASELAAEASFGHAAAQYAVRLGERAGVGEVVLFHHRPDRTDTALDDLARMFDDAAVKVTVAREDLVLGL